MKNLDLDQTGDEGHTDAKPVIKNIIGESLSQLAQSCQPQIRMMGEMVNTFSTVLERTTGFNAQMISSAAKRQPYLDRFFAEFDDPDYKVGLDLTLRSVIRSIDYTKNPEEFSLLQVVAGEAFQAELLHRYGSTGLAAERRPHLQEALVLHSMGYYSGSICMMYGLLEGIITEALEVCEVIYQKQNGKFYPVDPQAFKGNIVGLASKLKAGRQLNSVLSEHLFKIESSELTTANPGITITKARNDILHGTAFGYNTEKNSALMILWLIATLMKINAELSERNKRKGTAETDEAVAT